MRRKTTLFVTTVLALGALATPAAAMQPPGAPAQEHFGCLDGEDNAVGGHPGAAGLTHATPRVAELTDDPMPTAWNAVEHADPIELGSC